MNVGPATSIGRYIKRLLDRRLVILLVVAAGSTAACGAPPAPTFLPRTSVPTAPTRSAALTDLVAVGGWRALPDPASFQISAVEEVIVVPGGFVAAGCAAVSGPDCGVPAVWTSADGVAWSGPTLLPLAGDRGETYGVARAAAMTPMGLAVGGLVRRGDRIHAALWFSPDSRSFERVPDDGSFPDAAVVAMAIAGDRFVAVGSGAYSEYAGFRAWSSEDGRAWGTTVASGSDAAWPADTLALKSGLVAWGPTCTVCPPETAWWRSEDGLAWTASGTELGSGRFAYATAVGESSTGLVAFGTTGVDPVKPAAWSLGNGADRWEQVQPPAQPEGTPVRHYLLVGDVAVLGATSSRNPSSPTGIVWLSGPGDESWRPEIELPGVEIIALLQDPARVDGFVVVGRPPDEDSERFLWTGTVDLAR